MVIGWEPVAKELAAKVQGGQEKLDDEGNPKEMIGDFLLGDNS